MPKLIMTKGLPASGKSTWAKQFLEDNPNSIRINKDDLRAMLHNSVWSKGREKFVLEVRDMLIRKGLEGGQNVVVDDTNFAPKHEAALRAMAKELGADFIVQDFTDVSVQECIRRDLKRANSVGSKVILDMQKRYLDDESVQVEHDPSLPDCYIFDVDGTLALMNKRGPYDWDRVERDLPNTAVIQVYQSLRNVDVKMIVITGRDGVCEEETKKWLYVQGIEYDEFYIRPAGDMRKDAIVKKEIYDNHIKGKYNVLGIFDDRNQVVEMWRQQGLPVFQVADGDF